MMPLRGGRMIFRDLATDDHALFIMAPFIKRPKRQFITRPKFSKRALIIYGRQFYWRIRKSSQADGNFSILTKWALRLAHRINVNTPT